MAAQTTTGPRQGEAGFTLIELSIVLIIIGLLIGGVLQGQEMIANTRLKTTISQVDALTASVQTFQDKYNELPGDSDAVGTLLGLACGTATCDGDGQIGTGAGLNQGDAETPWAIAQLEAANLIQGIDGAGGTAALPARLDNTQLDVITGDMPDGTTQDILLVRFRATDAAPGGAPEPGLRSDEAFSIDQRYDDGVGNTGRFQALGTDNGETCWAGTPAVYSAATDTQVCTSAMRIN